MPVELSGPTPLPLTLDVMSQPQAPLHFAVPCIFFLECSIYMCSSIAMKTALWGNHHWLKKDKARVFHGMEKNNKPFSVYSYSPVSCSGNFEFQDQQSNSYSFNGPKGEGYLTDSELKRKRRITAYNGFTKEGKIKSSVLGSFKWIKRKFAGDLPYNVKT
ncbi:hypothetical protein SAY87_014219 [Trapa incisa]|uniref:Uncharacterized protein n=1 Tax=Trapa incisa TaxID=236973 RepID=A0AAN7GV95_9MYRT|nr:hypothetical protein SAY87_014219 [Trapa incisa]